MWKRLTPRAHWGLGWIALGLGLFVYKRFVLHEPTLGGLGLVAFGAFRVYQDLITPNIAELE